MVLLLLYIVIDPAIPYNHYIGKRERYLPATEGIQL